MDSISGLTSLAEVAIAACIAYLALERYRYRDQIKNVAADILTKVGVEGASDSDDRMADPSHNDIHLAMKQRNNANFLMLDHLRTLSEDGNDPVPDYIASSMVSDYRVYRRWYAGHRDRLIMRSALLSNVFTLVVLSAASVGWLSNNLSTPIAWAAFVVGTMALPIQDSISWKRYIASVLIIAFVSVVLYAGLCFWGAGADWSVVSLLQISLFAWLCLSLFIPVILVARATMMIEQLVGCMKAKGAIYEEDYEIMKRDLLVGINSPLRSAVSAYRNNGDD